ncbi:MAG: SAM-dependent methyltransferase, partial [Candidatus Omnitrophica bacterium]|nr:SAM-dependent methyltransferase [Candidatus Omnitrophota bacterium]
MAKNRLKRGVVYLVGAGPGDPGLFTVRGVKLLQRADAVVYDRLVNPSLLAYASLKAEKIYAGKLPDRHTLTQDEINKLLVRLAVKGKTVVRLKGGDPLLFGRGAEESLFMAKHGIRFEIVPGDR